MAKFNFVRSNFLLGEVGPRVYGRTDLEQYSQMAEELLNVQVLPQGGIKKRFGTRFVKDLSSYERGLSSGPDTESTSTIYPITAFDPTTSETTEDILYFNEEIALVVNMDEELVQSGVVGHVAYGDSGFYIDNDTPNSVFARNGNTYVFCTKDYYPLHLNSSEIIGGGIAPTYESWDNVNTGNNHKTCLPFDEETTSITFTPSATSGTITVTASATYFTSSMIGAYFRVRHSGTTGVIKITAVASGTSATATVTTTNNLGGTGASTAIARSQWGGGRPYPKSCCFFENRLWFLGMSDTGIPTVWASQIGDQFELTRSNLTAAIGDTDAYNFTIPSLDADMGMSLNPGSPFIITAKNRIYSINRIDDSLAFGVTNTLVKADVEIKCGPVRGVREGNRLLFPNKRGDKIQELFFDYREESNRTRDLNYFAHHISQSGIYNSDDFQQSLSGKSEGSLTRFESSADSSVSVALFKGAIPGGSGNDERRSMWVLTKDDNYGCLAWSEVVLGGFSVLTVDDNLDDLLESPTVLDFFCGLQENDTTENPCYVLVKRYVDGARKVYLEKLSLSGSLESQYVTDVFSGQVFLDCHASGILTAADTGIYDGLDHLEGETVSAFIQGFYVGEFTIAGGEIDLGQSYDNETFVIVGYNYTARAKLVSINQGSFYGSSLGLIKRVDELTLLLNKTAHIRFGVEGGRMQEIEFRLVSTPMNEPTPLFTGEKTFKIEAGPQTQQKIVLESVKPYPMEVSAVVLKGLVYDS